MAGGAEASCPHCGARFIQWRKDQVYCTPEHRQAAETTRRDGKPARTLGRQKAYGHAHRKARKAWAGWLADAGTLPCTLCSHPVYPGSAWHLDHVPGHADQYRGVAHGSDPCEACGRRCNELDGAERGWQRFKDKQSGASKRPRL